MKWETKNQVEIVIFFKTHFWNKIPWLFPDSRSFSEEFHDFSRFSLTFSKKGPFSRFSMFSRLHMNPVYTSFGAPSLKICSKGSYPFFCQFRQEKIVRFQGFAKKNDHKELNMLQYSWVMAQIKATANRSQWWAVQSAMDVIPKLKLEDCNPKNGTKARRKWPQVLPLYQRGLGVPRDISNGSRAKNTELVLSPQKS